MKAGDLFIVLLQIVLITLKITGVITVSWTLTLLPLWIVIILNLIFLLIGVIFVIIGVELP